MKETRDIQAVIVEMLADAGGKPITARELIERAGVISGSAHKAMGIAVARGRAHVELVGGMKFLFRTSIDASAFGAAAMREMVEATNRWKTHGARSDRAGATAAPRRSRSVPESEKPAFSGDSADYSRAKFTRAPTPKPRFDASGAVPLFAGLGIGRYVEAA